MPCHAFMPPSTLARFSYPPSRASSAMASSERTPAAHPTRMHSDVSGSFALTCGERVRAGGLRRLPLTRFAAHLINERVGELHAAVRVHGHAHPAWHHATRALGCGSHVQVHRLLCLKIGLAKRAQQPSEQSVPLLDKYTQTGCRAASERRKATPAHRRRALLERHVTLWCSGRIGAPSHCLRPPLSPLE